MKKHWTTFRGGEYPPRGADQKTISVSINHRRIIRVNKAALRALGDPQAVLLHYEEKQHIIGIQPINPRHEDAFRIKPANRGSAWRIHAASFCQHNKIDIDQNERFDNPEIDEDGILCLDLKRTHRVSRRGKE